MGRIGFMLGQAALKYVIIFISTILVSGIIALIVWDRTDTDYERMAIPVLPEKRVYLQKHRGIKAFDWYVTKVQLEKDDYSKYEMYISSWCDTAMRIPSQAYVSNVEIPGDKRQRYGQKFPDAEIDWWDAETVKNGFVFEKSYPVGCYYKGIFDDDRNIIYMYWSGY